MRILLHLKYTIHLLILNALAVSLAGAQTEHQIPVSADYIVYKIGTDTICARHTLSGEDIIRSEDAARVIQQTIDRLPVTGGRIYIAAGRYDLSKTIHITDKHGVHLEGAARGIVFSQGQEGTVLRSDLDIDLIEIFGDSLKMAGITISNLHLIGSGKQNGKAGILVRGNSDLLSLHQVGANHCGIGFYFKGGGGGGGGVIDAPQVQFCDPQVNGIGLKIERSHYAKIVGGEFSDCDAYGIMISSPETGPARTQGVKINSVTGVRNGRAGILIGCNTDCITVTGGSDFGGTRQGSGVLVSDEGTGRRPRNVILNGIHAYNNKTAGIRLDNADHVIVSACICSVHEHIAVRNAGQQYGIHIGENAGDVVVQGNITYDNAKQGVLDETGKALMTGNHDTPLEE